MELVKRRKTIKPCMSIIGFPKLEGPPMEIEIDDRKYIARVEICGCGRPKIIDYTPVYY